jgi:hypothetical protein
MPRAPARSSARCLINLLTTNAFIRLAPGRFVLREQSETANGQAERCVANFHALTMVRSPAIQLAEQVK